ncbi:hypothetical protein GCM10027436_72850 [Actinophytocola sediminis]
MSADMACAGAVEIAVLVSGDTQATMTTRFPDEFHRRDGAESLSRRFHGPMDAEQALSSGVATKRDHLAAGR